MHAFFITFTGEKVSLYGTVHVECSYMCFIGTYRKWAEIPFVWYMVYFSKSRGASPVYQLCWLRDLTHVQVLAEPGVVSAQQEVSSWLTWVWLTSQYTVLKGKHTPCIIYSYFYSYLDWYTYIYQTYWFFRNCRGSLQITTIHWQITKINEHIQQCLEFGKEVIKISICKQQQDRIHITFHGKTLPLLLDQLMVSFRLNKWPNL